jgi:hypothetical protein
MVEPSMVSPTQVEDETGVVEAVGAVEAGDVEAGEDDGDASTTAGVVDETEGGSLVTVTVV